MPSFDVAATVVRLLGEAPLSAHRVDGGRNAEVTRVAVSTGDYALKHYARADGPTRMAMETGALAFLARHGIEGVPRILGVDTDANAILMTWIDGEPIAEPLARDIQACASFAERLRELSRSPDAGTLPDAKEACGSVTEILRQIDRRIERISVVAERFDGLAHFLKSEIAPRRNALAGLAKQYPDPFPAGYRTLSPSDFGLHNAVRRSDGSLAFLDFEYFGWDDPVKLVADFVLHPGMGLAEPLCAAFQAQMSDVFSDMPNYDERLADLLPAFRLRWSLIMLNPILDSASGTSTGDGELQRIVQRQVDRVSRFLRSERV